jgi:hypothetical protein
LFAVTPANPPPALARRGRKRKPRLRITLADIEPPIWRRVRVADTYTLHQDGGQQPRPRRSVGRSLTP